MGEFRFERLEVWQRSVRFADLIYRATDTFPRSELFGLASQLRRASSSIGANLAEGSSRTSTKDFSRFVEIAYGSLSETLSHLHLAKLRGMIAADTLRELRSEAEELARMLSAFRSSLGKWKTGPEESE